MRASFAIGAVGVSTAMLTPGTGFAEAGQAELTRCNRFNSPIEAWAAVASGADEPIALRSLEPPVFLPDGLEFKTWETAAESKRTFYVAQGQPGASDENPGTEDRPWKTIGRAARTLEPGDRVIVHEGMYREWVAPERGGAGPGNMIVYQAAPGETVVLSGSEPLSGDWTPSAVADEPAVEKAWMIDLPVEKLGAYNPFAEINVTPMLMTFFGATAKRQGWDQPPYSLPRGLVFQDGRRLRQVAERRELADSAGTYWVEPGGKRVHVWPFDDRNPGDATFEISARPFAFSPKQAGLGFIRVDGFIIQHVANCFPMPQQGAISTKQGHHWIIANNVIRQVNALGLDYGWRQTYMPQTVPPDTPALAGVGTIVRRNTFRECGVCSMQGLGMVCGLIEDNWVEDCCWHDVEKLWEAAAMKLHWDKHVLIRRNVVHRTTGAPGIWVDHSNTNCRVTENVVVGVRSANYGGIFFEASYKPNLIDRNIVWGCEAHGVYQHNCGDLTIVNNLIGCCTKAPVYIAGQTSERTVDVETRRMSVVVRNQILGNVFYEFGPRGPLLPGGNLSDYNLFVNSPDEKPFDLGAWRQATCREQNSQVFESAMEFSPQDGTWALRQSPVLPELECPRIFEVMRDILGAPLPVQRTCQAGPFVKENLQPAITLDVGALHP